MQQSRLEKFFIITTTTTTNKRSSTMENDDNNKKFKCSNSQSNDQLENNFSLNQFYLEKFLLILSSTLIYHKELFDKNEFILFDNFQKLTG